MDEVDLSKNADMNFKPTLNIVHNLLDMYIEGEFDTRLAVFTNWLLAHQNVNLAGQRAAGKTWLSSNVARFLPEKNGLYNMSSGSDKSGYYQAEKIRAHTHILVPELNKLNATNKELLKDFGEGRDAKYDVVIFEGGNRRVQTYTIPPRPFIFCLADEQEDKIDDQLRSRLTVIRTDISEAQNMAVNIRQAEEALLPSNPRKYNIEDFNNMRNHIATLPPWDEKSFRHPAANIFVGCIPTIFTDCRRDFPKYLKNTYGITRFYWKERIRQEINTLDNYDKLVKRDILFVTPEDMYYNHIVYGTLLVESSLRCTNIERSLIGILQKNKEPMNRNSIQAKVRQAGMNVSAHMITRHMSSLSDLGYVEVYKVGSTPATYGVGQLFKDFTFDINWSNIIAESIKNIKKYYPTIADDYIKRFCDNPTVTNPFSGVVTELRKIEEKPVSKSDLEKHFTPEELDENPKVEVEDMSDEDDNIDEEVL